MRYCCYAEVPTQFNTKYRLPFYTADENNSLERGKKLYNVDQILRGVFHEDYQKAIQNYLDLFPEDVAKAIGKKGSNRFRLIWLGRPRIESSLKQQLYWMAVDLVFDAKIEMDTPVANDRNLDSTFSDITQIRTEQTGISLRLRYVLSLWKKSCSAPMIAPSNLFPPDFLTEQETAITNQYLLPIMYTSDYPKAARLMLKRYYPEALEQPKRVDGRKLADIMDLTVKRVRFPFDSKSRGRIFFDDTTVTLIDEDGKPYKDKIPSMTILINRNLCYTSAIENATIVHECVHFFLDLPFFLLQMLSGRPYRSYSNRTVSISDRLAEWEGNKKNGPIEWMELQTEKVTAYAMIEETQARLKIDQMLAERGGVRSPENLVWVMNHLSSFYNVSRTMAKYRMIELGYPEAEGIFNFVNHQRIPDYGCSGSWPENTTYTISLTAAGELLGRSARFAELLQSGRYIYIDGHYCLNMEPYIERNHRNEKKLTDYALHHIDECCLSFSVRGRYTDVQYKDGQAARKKPAKDRNVGNHFLKEEPKDANKSKKNKTFVRDANLCIQLKNIILCADNVADAIREVAKKMNTTLDAMITEIGISRNTYYGWLDKGINKRQLVCVAIGLNLRADVGEALVEAAGYSFGNRVEDNVMKAMLYEPEMTVARGNEIMSQYGFSLLTFGNGI